MLGTEEVAAALWEYVPSSNGWDGHREAGDKYLTQGHSSG